MHFLYVIATATLLALVSGTPIETDPELPAELADLELVKEVKVKDAERRDPYQQLFFEFQKRLAYEREQEQVHALEKRMLECKAAGDGCRGLPKCCGSLQCYWPAGYSMFKDGTCVTCVNKYQKCQRDSQCCSGLVCDKGNALWVDGRCVAPRASGSCYRDDQCAGSCQKKWWQLHGQCSV